MSMQRITVTLPKYLYEDLTEQIPAGQVSGFVAEAVETHLMESGGDPIEEFIKLRRKLPKVRREDIVKAIRKGRI